VNKLKLLILFYFLLFSSAAADTIRLVDAPIGAVSSYFSQLTGNIYILDFEPKKKISLKKEISGKENIHRLFVEIIEGLGGEVSQISDKTFAINKKESSVSKDSVTPLEVDVISLERLYLGGKISKTGVKELIKQIPIFSGLNIISDDSTADALLVSGEKKSIAKLRNMIGNLEKTKEILPVPQKTVVSENLPSKELVPSKDVHLLKVIDLNFADAGELVETLSPVLSSDPDTKTVSVSAHKSANQVILSGPNASLEQAIQVIAEMDRAPRQVYVDAIIAEISEDSADKLGLQFSINDGSFSTSVVSGQAGSNIGTLAGDAFLTGAVGGLLAVGSGASKIPDIGIMINALKSDTDNRILATPSLMTTENKESTILIGQNVPFITGQFTNQQGDGATPFQTIKREDLGTMLKIKPKIGKQGDIIMEIWQEISRIDQSVKVLSDVVTVKRQISTVVSAKQGETIAIGGLRVEQEEIGVSKVPFLGDIPVLGMLFKQESSQTISRNLAIFLRPTLVSAKNQRNQVLKTWRTNLGRELFEYEGNEMVSKKPKPVGQRLNIPSLRPKLRPVTGN
jgi:general secretion pathway protein D